MTPHPDTSTLTCKSLAPRCMTNPLALAISAPKSSARGFRLSGFPIPQRRSGSCGLESHGAAQMLLIFQQSP